MAMPNEPKKNRKTKQTNKTQAKCNTCNKSHILNAAVFCIGQLPHDLQVKETYLVVDLLG